MGKMITWCVAAVMAVTGAIMPASAQFAGPRAPIAAAGQDSSGVEQVQYRWRKGHRGYQRHGRYRSHRGYYSHRRYYPRRHYGYRRHYGSDGFAIATGIIGLAAGAAIASSGNQVSYCESRFRSYDRRSGTYLGYDGRRHRCP